MAKNILKSPLSLAGILFISVFCFSCAKSSIENSLTEHGVPILTRGPYLTKMYVIDTTQPGTADTLNKITLSYDNSMRLSEYIDSGKSSMILTVNRYKCIYNNTDTVARRIIFSSLQTTSWSTTFNTYDTIDYTFQNATCVTDTNSQTGISSSVTWVATYHNKNTYTYTPYGIKLLRKQYDDHNLLSNYSQIEFYQSWINGNLMGQLDSSKNFWANGTSTGGAMPDMRTETSFAYTNNPDPLYKTQLAAGRPYFKFNNPHMSCISKNLVTSEISTQSYLNAVFSTSYSIHYSYLFRPDGYPVSGVKIYQKNAEPVIATKLAYLYR